MRRHWAVICGVAILVCAICVASSADGTNARMRANEANERMCSRSTTNGTQAEACATGSVMQAQGAAQAQGQGGGEGLHLLPRPREVKETLPASGQAGGAAFKVTRRTRIVVSSALGGRDFEGAQMLDDEIEQWTGWRLKVSDAREMPGASEIIYIGDAMKDSKLRNALEKQGLSMQKGFDEQGYEISADAHRILVGGASVEGAFYGVQTLRQLLRPENATGMNEKAGSSAPFANTATGLPSPKMLRAGGMTWFKFFVNGGTWVDMALGFRKTRQLGITRFEIFANRGGDGRCGTGRA